MKLFIVGNLGGTNVGSSFYKCSKKLGFETYIYDVKSAQINNKWINSIYWKLFFKRFPLQQHFNRKILEKIKCFDPDLIITTGHNPVIKSTLRKIAVMEKSVVHFSTDDPWNKSQKTKWFLGSLPYYKTIYTPRKSNIEDFIKLGCKHVEYLPFAYDEEIFDSIHQVKQHEKDIDVLFVGGGDKDRRLFFNELLNLNIKFLLAGSYWNNYPEFKGKTVGNKSPEEIINLTLRAKINLCLVRRANRDGHVMRTFEMGAIGASMLVEETDEHKEIFGEEKEMVYYFNSPENAALKIQLLLDNSVELNRIQEISKNRIVGFETYTKRLLYIIKNIK
jgi:spore maturation protein CgeB